MSIEYLWLVAIGIAIAFYIWIGGLPDQPPDDFDSERDGDW